MVNLSYLCVAYAIIFAVIFGYVLFIWRRPLGPVRLLFWLITHGLPERGMPEFGSRLQAAQRAPISRQSLGPNPSWPIFRTKSQLA